MALCLGVSIPAPVSQRIQESARTQLGKGRWAREAQRDSMAHGPPMPGNPRALQEQTFLAKSPRTDIFPAFPPAPGVISIFHFSQSNR